MILLALAPVGVTAQSEEEKEELRTFELELVLFRAVTPEHLDEAQWREARERLAEAAAARAAAGTPAPSLSAVAPPAGAAPAQPADTPAPGSTPEGATPAAGAAAAPGPERGSTLPGRRAPGDPDAGTGVAMQTAGALDDAVPGITPPEYGWTPAPPETFTPLDAQTHELASVTARLARADAYEVLMHERWRQFTFPRNEAAGRGVVIDSDSGFALRGEVRLAVERRLHLALDLVLTDPEGIEYRLNQTRVMTSGEIHYIDHPAFGAIALVTRAEFPEAFPARFREELVLDVTLLPRAPTPDRPRGEVTDGDRSADPAAGGGAPGATRETAPRETQ